MKHSQCRAEGCTAEGHPALHGCCSSRCEDAHEYEEEIAALRADLEELAELWLNISRWSILQVAEVSDILARYRKEGRDDG